MSTKEKSESFSSFFCLLPLSSSCTSVSGRHHRVYIYNKWRRGSRFTLHSSILDAIVVFREVLLVAWNFINHANRACLGSDPQHNSIPDFCSVLRCLRSYWFRKSQHYSVASTFVRVYLGDRGSDDLIRGAIYHTRERRETAQACISLYFHRLCIFYKYRPHFSRRGDSYIFTSV